MSNNMALNTQQTFNTTEQVSLVQTYLAQANRYLQQKYDQCPAIVRLTILIFAVLSTIPIVCFTVFIASATMGCLIVFGIGIAGVLVRQLEMDPASFFFCKGSLPQSNCTCSRQGECAAIISAVFLVPTLAIVQLLYFTALAVISLSFSCFRIFLYGFAIINPSAARKVQDIVEKKAKNMMILFHGFSIFISRKLMRKTKQTIEHALQYYQSLQYDDYTE